MAALKAVAGQPLYPVTFAEMRDDPDALLDLVARLKKEKARQIDATAAWEAKVRDVEAKLQNMRQQSGLYTTIVDRLTFWARWLGAGAILLLAGFHVAKALVFGRRATAVIYGILGAAAAGIWCLGIGYLVRLAVWGFVLLAACAAVYAGVLAFTTGKLKLWWDKQITAIQRWRTTMPEPTVRTLDSELNSLSDAAMRGYVDRRKEKLALKRRTHGN